MELDRRFDLTREFPPLVFPPKQAVDLDAVSAALVGAAKLAPAIKTLAESGDDVDPDSKKIAEFSLSVLGLLEVMWERVLRPLAAGPSGPASGGRAADPPPPAADADRKALADALAISDKTAILYDANLGTVPIANRQKLCHALSVGIRAAAVAKAEGKGADPGEAVRLADDALSLVNNMSFMGQASAPPNKERNPDAKHCSMPIRVEFEDRGARIHFERTIYAQCGLRATMSLPKPVRIAQKKFLDSVRGSYPDEIVMVRVDTEKLRFNVFHKPDGGPKWLAGAEWMAIPFNILTGGDGEGGAELPAAAAGGE
jgi:hypothetical protein